MSRFDDIPAMRAQTYAHARGVSVLDHVDTGHDGTIFRSSRKSILKVHERQRGYEVERRAYLRLREHRVVEVLGHAVPQVLGTDNELCVLELSVVSRPYVLDFGKAALDTPWNAEFPAEVMCERWAYWESCFEARHWPQVLAIVSTLTRYGIFLHDLHPGNIAFAD